MRRIIVSLSLTSLALLSACSAGGSSAGNNSSVTDSGDTAGTMHSQAALPAGTQLLDPTHGKQTSLAYGAVSGENGTLANGVATARYFQDGSTMVTVQANIADAAAGTHYEAWLTSDGMQPIDMGELQSTKGDVRHALEYTSKNDLHAYTTIVISLEHTGGGSSRGQTVGSAILKAPIK